MPHATLPELERWVLHRTLALEERCLAAYEAFEYHVIYHALNNFCSVDLSALFLDVRKDRLYCERADSPSRRAAQTVLWEAFDVLCRMLAPILAFTAEEAYRSGPHPNKDKHPSVHLLLWPKAEGLRAVEERISKDFLEILKIRDKANSALEALKAAGTLKAPLEGWLRLGGLDPAVKKAMEAMASELPDLFGVSKVTFEGADVSASPCPDEKCPRCWKRTSSRADSLCSRCEAVVLLSNPLPGGEDKR